ncbi:MAG: hypothetical protein WCP66_00515 [Methylococcales bacterium]
MSISQNREPKVGLQDAESYEKLFSSVGWIRNAHPPHILKLDAL